MSRLPAEHDVPTGATYEEVSKALENRYGDHHLKEGFQLQLKRRTQHVGESLQEFAAAIDHLAHLAHVVLPEYVIRKEATLAFADGMKELDVRRQPCLGPQDA
jgi:hypothetical protein